MKKAMKLLALMLAGLMLCSSFAACGGGGGADTADTTAPTHPDDTGATIPETEKEDVDPIQTAIDFLKETTDWGGKTLTVMYSADIAGYSEEVENVMENGNVVNEAVHKRNVLFEEYAKLKYNTMPVGQHEIITKLQAEVRAPNGDFQFLSNRSSRSRCAYILVSVCIEKPEV